MKLELKYQITCNGALMFERETPEEILEIWEDNVKELKELEREVPDRVKGYTMTDTRFKFFPHGTQTEYIDGETIFYELKTIITQL